jgi:hypothetical protein
MDSFINLKNALITENQTLKRTQVIPAQFVKGSGGYGSIMTFDLERVRRFNGLSNMFIQMNQINMSVAITQDISLFTANLVNDVVFRTKGGITLMRYNNLHQIERIQGSEESPLFSRYVDCTTLNVGSTVCYLPVFSWCNYRNKLDLRAIEPLELQVSLDDLTGIYAGTEFVSAKFELICVFNDFVNSPVEEYGNSLYDPKKETVRDCYDLYYEPVVNLATGSTTATITLSNPYPATCMHVVCKTSKIAYHPIRKVVLDGPNEGSFVDIPDVINFNVDEFTASGNSNDSLNFTHFFTNECKTLANEFELEKALAYFSSYLLPTRVTVTFESAVPANSQLFVYFEFPSKLNIDSQGIVSKQATGIFKPGIVQNLDNTKF